MTAPKKTKMKTWKYYNVTVHDPVTDSTGQYFNVRAVSPEHADRQGRDAFCGLLGEFQEQYDRLEVTAELIP